MVDPLSLRRLVREASHAPFVSHSLAVDPQLWGGFWHSDVISAGYTLPALELALLLAVRLDRSWPPGTDPAQFLADLQSAVSQPQAGVWTLFLARTPVAVFAAPCEISERPAPATTSGDVSRISTVVWYGLDSGCLHAGYRGLVTEGHFAGMVCQRKPGFRLAETPSTPPAWLAEAIEQRTAGGFVAAHFEAKQVTLHPVPHGVDAEHPPQAALVQGVHRRKQAKQK